MSLYLSFLIIIEAALLFYFLNRLRKQLQKYFHKKHIKPPKKPGYKLPNGPSGIYKATIKRIADKKANKDEIIKLMEKMGKISNADVREALNIPRRTAARYLDELEVEGKIHRIGKAGYNVFYCRK